MRRQKILKLCLILVVVLPISFVLILRWIANSKAVFRSSYRLYGPEYQAFLLRKAKYLKYGCRVRKNILFLQTHFAGGEPVTNLLNRFGDIHNLSIALPKEDSQDFYWPLSFDKTYADTYSTYKRPNIFSYPARFNKFTMKKLMPPGTVFTTILRNPVTQLEAVFTSLNFPEMLKLGNYDEPLKEFLENPFEILKNASENSKLVENFHFLSLLRNGQMFDLGFNPTNMVDNDDHINNAVLFLEQTFHLVMIAEYLDESLVLLARKMCWSLDDVVYFRLNGDHRTERTVSENLRKKIYSWNKADVQLYDYFNKSFWEEVEKMGPVFQVDVEIFKHKVKQMEDRCLEPVINKTYKTSSYYKLKDKLPRDLKEVCKAMYMNENDYLGHLRRKYLKVIRT